MEVCSQTSSVDFCINDVEVLMTIRAYALYNNSRLILTLLIALGLSMIIFGSVWFSLLSTIAD